MLGNVSNLQSIFVRAYGTNGALWTLANEFWYYMTAPLLFAPLFTRFRRLRWVLFVAGLILLLTFTIQSPDHGAGFVLWCIGALAALLPRPFVRRPVAAVALFLVTLLCFRVGMRAAQMDQFWPRFFSDLVVAASLANAIIALRLTKSDGYEVSKINAKLAGFSYSLYVIHTPLLMIICAALETYLGYGWHETPVGWKMALTATLTLVSVLSAAYIFSLCTEAKTWLTKAWLRKMFAKANSAGMASGPA